MDPLLHRINSDLQCSETEEEISPVAGRREREEWREGGREIVIRLPMG